MRIIKDIPLDEDEKIIFDNVKKYLTKEVPVKYGHPENVLRMSAELLSLIYKKTYRIYSNNPIDFEKYRKYSVYKCSLLDTGLPLAHDVLIMRSLALKYYELGFLLSNVIAYKRSKKTGLNKTLVFGIPTLKRMFTIKKLSELMAPDKTVKSKLNLTRATMTQINEHPVYNMDKFLFENFLKIKYKKKYKSKSTIAGKIAIIKIRNSKGNIVDDKPVDQRYKRLTKEKKLYYQQHPSESPDLASWKKKDDLTQWTNSSILGYYADRFLYTFEYEDTVLCIKRPERHYIIKIIAKFKDMYFQNELNQNLAIKQYIDWAFRWIEENSWYENFGVKTLFRIEQNYILGQYRKDKWKNKKEEKNAGTDWTDSSAWEC